jgi:hypothetical protein
MFFSKLGKEIFAITIKKKKKKGKSPGAILSFLHFFFLLNTWITRGVLDIFL